MPVIQSVTGPVEGPIWASSWHTSTSPPPRRRSSVAGPLCTAVAAPSWSGEGALMEAKAAGVDVLTVTLPYKSRPADLDDVRRRVDFVTNINDKVVPQIDGSPGLCRLTARDLTDIEVRECWNGRATGRIDPRVQAALHRLPVVEMLDSSYWLGDFSLDGGVVLHDYLAAP